MFDGSCLSLLWKHASFFQHLLLNICIITPIRSYYPLTDFFCCWNFDEAMEKLKESASEESPKEGVLQRSHQKKECFRGVTKRRSASEESPKEGVLQRSQQKKECFRGVTKRREETKNSGAEGSHLHVTFITSYFEKNKLIEIKIHHLFFEYFLLNVIQFRNWITFMKQSFTKNS